MIRFVIDRGASHEVSLKALQGEAVLEHAEIVSVACVEEPLGFGRDPQERCEALAYLLLFISLQREPLAAAYFPAFARQVVQKVRSDSWTISSMDVKEWVLDTLCSQAKRGCREGFCPRLYFTEGADDLRN